MQNEIGTLNLNPSDYQLSLDIMAPTSIRHKETSTNKNTPIFFPEHKELDPSSVNEER